MRGATLTSLLAQDLNVTDCAITVQRLCPRITLKPEWGFLYQVLDGTPLGVIVHSKTRLIFPRRQPVSLRILRAFVLCLYCSPPLLNDRLTVSDLDGSDQS
jgi:hypothetical protein